MAEGGPNDREPPGNNNPFSFQRFVKKKVPSQTDNGDDVEDDNIQLPDVSSSNSERTASDEGKDAKKNVDDTTTTDQTENPFSFKKFLKSSGSGGTERYSNRGQNGLAMNYPSDLPDFVQDHYSNVGENVQERLQFRDPLELPDFVDTSNLGQFRHENSGSSGTDQGHVNLNEAALESHGGLELSPRLHLNLENGADMPRQHPDINASNLDEMDINDDGPQLASSLPDFLSDGAIGNRENTSGQPWPGYRDITVQLSSNSNVAACTVDGEVELELRRLRKENEDLRHRLTTQTNRLSKAQREIETIKKREADDTAALENMVHQVEANLVTTTQRAVKAESLVTKLKQDLKSAQSHLTTAQRENSILQSGDQVVMNIRERTKYASEQLSSAATNAEQSLKQLLTGVESMKVLSEVLASIDKVTEIDSPSTEGQS